MRNILPSIFMLFFSLNMISVKGQTHIIPDIPKDTLPAIVNNLQPVIIKATIHPKIKKDTLEYNTVDIHLQPNAVIEEMLTRFPGLRVDINGNITYNGDRINRILIDGEDLFASDPTVVTRNLNADMVARIQVINEKSAASQFTGIDDGVSRKTLNLILKEEARNKYFSKVEAGANTNSDYNVNGLIGSFHGKEQLMTLGMAANIGGLGFDGASGNSQDGLFINSGSYDPLGASAGIGIPRVAAAGMHYSNTWNANADHIMGNFEYGNLFTRPTSSTITQQILPDSVFVQRQTSNSINSQDQHQFYMKYNKNVDTSYSLQINLNGRTMRGQNLLNTVTNSSVNNQLVNSSLNTIQSNVATQGIGGSLSLKKMDAKNSLRTFSFISDLSITKNSTAGHLYSLEQFTPDNSSDFSADTIDQRKQLDNHSVELGVDLGYTEPLGRSAILGLQYGINIQDDKSMVATYARTGVKYDAYIDSLSTNVTDIILNQDLLLNLHGESRNINYTVGNKFIYYTPRQRDFLTDSTINYTHVNVSPFVLVNYIPDPFRTLYFKYNTAIQPPAIAQLQPLKINNNPLNIFIGNPLLQPSFIQNFTLGWQNTKPFIMNLQLVFGLTNNAIVNKVYVDSLGRQVSQPFNISGGEQGNIDVSVDQKLASLDANVGVFANLQYSRNENYIDNELSENRSIIVKGGINWSKFVADKYSIREYSQITRFSNMSSINSTAATSYWTQLHYLELAVFPLHGLAINTSANYNWEGKTTVFDKTISVCLWNASVSQNLLKNRLTIKLTMNNLLDQQSGIMRINTANINTETSTNVIGRYWLLSATYRFEHQRKTN